MFRTLITAGLIALDILAWKELFNDGWAEILGGIIVTFLLSLLIIITWGGIGIIETVAQNVGTFLAKLW